MDSLLQEIMVTVQRLWSLSRDYGHREGGPGHPPEIMDTLQEIIDTVKEIMDTLKEIMDTPQRL